MAFEYDVNYLYNVLFKLGSNKEMNIRNTVVSASKRDSREDRKSKIMREIVIFCEEPKTFLEIMERFNYRGKKFFRQSFIYFATHKEIKATAAVSLLKIFRPK